MKEGVTPLPPTPYLDIGWIRLTLVKKIDSDRNKRQNLDDEVLRSNTLHIKGP